MRLNRWITFALPLATVLIASQARATCNSLICICTATVTGVSFGSYDPTLTTDNTSVGSVQVLCILTVSSGGSYVISLTHGQGSYTSRSMTQGTKVLSYNLYTASGLGAPVWGDGTGATLTVAGSFPASLLNSQTFNVYGRITAQQNVPPALYQDTIMVTVTY